MSAPREMLILLGEDNPHDVQLLMEAVDLAGHNDWRVEHLSDGEALADRLRCLPGAADFQLMLLDARLPKRSAAELLGDSSLKIRSLCVPVVVLSSVLAESQVAELRGLGATHVWEKPVDFDDLLLMVERFGELMAKPFKAPVPAAGNQPA